MIRFRDYFFGLLPPYFKKNDTNKNLSGDGLLERYLRIFGLELDERLLPLADGYISGTNLDPTVVSIIDPSEAPNDHLTYLAFTLGNPPDLLGNPSLYRKLLIHIVAAYKIKGTKPGYKLFFALLGYNVSIVELPTQTFLYDDATYDDNQKYDSSCPTCSEYELILSPWGLNCFIPEISIPDQTTLDLLMQVVNFNEPINAVLKRIIAKAIICDAFKACCTEQITVRVIDPTQYDEVTSAYDSSSYDNNVVEWEQTYTYDCTSNTAPAALLTEDGAYLTLEDGSKILITS